MTTLPPLDTGAAPAAPTEDAREGHSTMANWALAGAFLLPIVGLPLGIIAHNRDKKAGRRYGRAKAAWIISGSWIGMLVVIIATAAAAAPTTTITVAAPVTPIEKVATPAPAQPAPEKVAPAKVAKPAPVPAAEQLWGDDTMDRPVAKVFLGTLAKEWQKMGVTTQVYNQGGKMILGGYGEGLGSDLTGISPREAMRQTSNAFITPSKGDVLGPITADATSAHRPAYMKDLDADALIGIQMDGDNAVITVGVWTS